MPTARTSFKVVVDGRLVDVTAGDVVDPNHRIVKVRPDLFDTDPVPDSDVARCPVDGCDYTGSERGLKAHSRVHKED